MTGVERPQVEVAVALVTDPKQRVFLTLSESWSAFTPPMDERRRTDQGAEPWSRAALRAAVEALGVPVRLVEGGPLQLKVPLHSGRELVDKLYTYNVFHVEPHPDFADALQTRKPHLWLSPHQILSGQYEPISWSARFILRDVLHAFDIPARVQHTSVLVAQRVSPERGRQFLLRREAGWGYALPTKRWDPPAQNDPAALAAAALAAAQRVAREELGVEPGRDAAITPATPPEYTNHGISPTKGAPAFGAETDYVHALFRAELRPPGSLRSDQPLAWVTDEEVQLGYTAAADGPGTEPGPWGRISRTVPEILTHLGLLEPTGRGGA